MHVARLVCSKENVGRVEKACFVLVQNDILRTGTDTNATTERKRRDGHGHEKRERETTWGKTVSRYAVAGEPVYLG